MDKNIQSKYVKNILLGDNAYSSVVMRIASLLENARGETIVGNDFMKKMYVALNESKTPIITIREFLPDGSELSKNDAKLKDVIDFIKKNTEGNVDFNFLINLVKEEHFVNMMKNGHIAPEITVEKIKEEFDKSSGEIVKKINEGIFDDMSSTLLSNIKKVLKPEEPVVKEPQQNLNESALFKDNFVKYNPIGFMVVGNKGDNMAIVEGKILQFTGDSLGNIVTKVVDPKDGEVDIRMEHYKLMKAIDSCIYNPETNEFTPKEAWDFLISLNPNGTVKITKEDGEEVDVKPDDVQKLFIESLNVYENDFSLVPNYNRAQYMEDADNFNTLVANAKDLIKFSNIEVVKNLYENNSIMYSDSLHKNTPFILSNGTEDNKVYDSYAKLVEDCNLKMNAKNLFESIVPEELSREAEVFNSKINRIQKLNENNNNISKEIENINNLKLAAEENSPYMVKLDSMLASLNAKMLKNIEELKQLKSVEIY